MKFTPVHQNFNVSDLSVSMKFYEEALGLTEINRIENPAFTIVYVGNDSGFVVELTCIKDHPQKYDLGECEFHLAFKSDDFQKAHEFHEKMGCICFENPAMGIYFIEDPDGYWLEIIP